MTEKVFCHLCGNECTNNMVYCPNCGISLINDTDFNIRTKTNQHCATCGQKLNTSDIYCSNCGFESTSYEIEFSQKNAILDLKQNILNTQGILSTKTIDDIKKSIKDSSFWISALTFACVAVITGLLISFFIDLLISNKVNSILHETISNRDFYNFFRTSDIPNVKLGATTIWLLSCLGGFSAKGAANISGDITTAQIKFSLGFVTLLIIPIISLFIGNISRKTVCNYKYPNKQITIQESIAGAFLFAFINLLLNIIFARTGNWQNSISLYTQDLVRLSSNAQISSIGLNVFIYSFAIALVFAVPNFKLLLEQLNSNNKALANYFVVGINFIKRILIAGFLATLVFIFAFYIKSNYENLWFIDENSKLITSLFFMLPNMVVWFAILICGGSLGYNINIDSNNSGNFLEHHIFSLTHSKFIYERTNISIPFGNPKSQFEITWFGWLFVIIAIWVGVSLFYKHLFNENDKKLFAKKAIGMCLTSALLFFIVVMGASFSGNMIFQTDFSTSKLVLASTSISFLNTLRFFVLSAISVCIVYIAKTNNSVDRIICKLLSPYYIYSFTVIISIIIFMSIKTGGNL